MNAALIAACAVAARRNAYSDYIIPYEHLGRGRQPIIGMIKIQSNSYLDAIPDMTADGVELRFRSVFAVDKFIQELEQLRKNMLVLEGGAKHDR